MNDQFDKKLADKIRREMANYEPAYDPEDWKDLQARMNHGRHRVPRVAMILLCSTLLFTFSQPLNHLLTTHELPTFLSDTNAETPADPQADVTAQANMGQPLRSATLGNTSAATSPRIPSSIGTEETLNQTVASSTAIAQGPSPRKTDLIGQPTEIPASPAQTIAEQTQSPSPAAAEQGITNEENIAETKPVFTLSQVQATEQLQKTTYWKSVSYEPLKEMPVELAREKLSATESAQASNFSQIMHKRGTFALAASPSLHYNERMGYRRPGGSLGLLYELPIGKRLHVSTGVMATYAKAKFIPDQSNYLLGVIQYNRQDANAFPGFSSSSFENLPLSNTVRLMTIESSILSMEIPLMVRFDLLPKANRQLYLAGGVSTYFNLYEKHFHQIEQFELPVSSNFKLPEIPDYTETYGPLESTDWFSTIYLGFGIERRAGAFNTVSFEPHVKIPVTGLGMKDAPVYTGGVMLKYHFR